MDFRLFPYLRQLYADPSEKIVLQTGTQTGKTEWVLCDAFALISLGLAVQNVQPKDDARSQFIRTRIYPQMRMSEYYAQHLSTAGSLADWSGGGTLRLTFSNVEDEMIAFPADAVSVDEVDFCNIRNLALLPDRMMGSPYRIERRTSTPTTVGHAGCQNINFHYESSDRKIWLVECPACHTYQPITWEENIVEETRDPKTGGLTGYRLRDDHWHVGLDRDPRVLCKHCAHPINRLGSGVWHRRNPKASVSGYNLNKFSSPLISIAEAVHDYSKSQGNPRELQRFANSYSGVPYQGVGDKVTEEMLALCAQDYQMLERNLSCMAERPCSMGIDVGPKWLDVRISDHPFEGVRRALFIGKVKWHDLVPLIQQFRVRLAVIDEEPERSKSIEFQDQAPCRVVMCCNRELSGAHNEGCQPSLAEVRMKMSNKRITIDRTVWMDNAQSSYARRNNWIPRNWRTLLDGAYMIEMTTPTRVLEMDDKGVQKYVWTSGRDHSFLADVYDLVATLCGGFLSDNGPMVKTDVPRKMALSVSAPMVTNDKVFEMA